MDLHYSATFQNTDRKDLFAGDMVSLESACAWDLEPFGRLAFRFEGQGSGHVVSLVLRDVQGNERLIWRHRDASAEGLEFIVPTLFEGNDVFDAGRVRQVCLVLDEGNLRSEQVNSFQGSLRICAGSGAAIWYCPLDMIRLCEKHVANWPAWPTSRNPQRHSWHHPFIHGLVQSFRKNIRDLLSRRRPR